MFLNKLLCFLVNGALKPMWFASRDSRWVSRQTDRFVDGCQERLQDVWMGSVPVCGRLTSFPQRRKVTVQLFHGVWATSEHAFMT